MEIPAQHTRQIEQVDDVHTTNRNSLTVTLLFLLSPFVALLVALKKYKASWAKNVVWFFVVFYGFTFVIVSDYVDSAGYRDHLIELHSVDLNLRNFSQLFFQKNQNCQLLLQPLARYIC